MRRKKHYSVLSCALAAVLALTAIPVDVSASENLALNKTATASSYEVDSTSPEKAVDGDLTTRWGTGQNLAAGEYIEVNLGSEQQIGEIIIRFERGDDAQNILGYHVDLDGETVYTKTTKASQVERITFDETKSATNLRVTIDSADGGTINWVNVGINEIEVYAEAGEVSLEEVVAQLEATAGITTNALNLPMPEVPEGYTVAFNGTDFEEIMRVVGDDVEILLPMTDKEVQVSFEVTETATGETAVTDDITYVIEGQYEQAEGMNEKPKVIPEIQEWYAYSANKLPVEILKEVYYSDDSLEPMVDEFIADYETFTGTKLEKATDKIKAETINFVKEEQDLFLGEEGYLMEIVDDGIIVTADSVTGNMYAAQTILQMVKQNPDELPVGNIRDYPRFEVRGFMLDIARKPIGMDMIREIARTMRYYKMNDFQLHLSDNYIFLENYGYGDTEELGFDAYEAFRLESSLTNDVGESPTAEDYYISKADMREFIQEQRALGMNIIPEIDLPAHATSFTKVWPELMVAGEVSPLNSSRPLIDHFDLTNEAAVNKIIEIFDDYTVATDDTPATFDADTIVHVGADEFVYDYTAYREFVNTIVPHVKETNTVRMWGGLTWIDDGATEITQEAIENVQMNLWSSDWADGLQMYEMGYKLINTIDDYGYLVPNGNLTRSNSYGDLLNVDRIFDSFKVNRVKTRSGYVELPSSDDQILGAVYALWSDNIDKHASGLSESDLYYRFFDAMPFYAEKTWAATGQEKGSAAELTALAQELGTGPRTNPYYQEEKSGNTYESYNFDNGLEDNSANNRDLTAGTATVADGALTLAGGNSYVTSPITKVGNGNELVFDITLTEEAEAGDILFEADAEYGTHDIRIMDDGKLGFTRELYNYYFDYELPVGETVNIRIYAEQQNTVLYVNDELIGEASGKYIHNDTVKKEGITHTTFALPVQRIGSTTNAITAIIDNVVVKANTDIKPDNADYDYEGTITYTTGSEQTQSGNEGPIELAFDGDTSTYWHSEWSPSWSTSELEDYLWVEFELEGPTMVDAIRYLPRPAGNRNGDITGYRVEGTTDGTTWTILTTGTWTSDGQNWKLAEFEPTEVTGLRLVATSTYADTGNNKFASAAELRVRTYVEPEEEIPEEDVTEIFSDVAEGKWYVENIQYVYNKGLMSGSNDLFKPTGEVTRAQVVTTLYRLAGSPEVTDYSACEELSDVKENKWYTDAICWAYSTGVTTGNTNTMTFNVNTPVTRQQLASFFYRYADYMGYDTTATADISSMLNANQVSSYAETAVKWAVGVGLISGSEVTDANGNVVYDLKPQSTATRAQLAAILQRFCEGYGL